MNTLEIEAYGKSNAILCKSFLGCFPCNALPRKKIPTSILPVGCVVNLCDSSRTNDATCHWVGVWIGKNKDFEYFDSGGGGKETSFRQNAYIKRFISHQNTNSKILKVTMSNSQIQSYTSNRCGKFVLCYLYAKSLNISMRTYVHVFRRKSLLERNDAIVDSLFDCAFNNNNNNVDNKQNQNIKKGADTNCFIAMTNDDDGKEGEKDSQQVVTRDDSSTPLNTT